MTKGHALARIEPIIAAMRDQEPSLRQPGNAFECRPRVVVSHRAVIDVLVPAGEPAVDDPRIDLSGLLFCKNDGGKPP